MQALPQAKVEAIAADLGTAEGVETFIKRAGDADILVNNLGIFEPKPFVEITDADWHRFFDINVMSGVRLSRHYLPGNGQARLGPHRLHLERVGPQHSGRDDPLRHDQDRPACDLARARRNRSPERA